MPECLLIWYYETEVPLTMVLEAVSKSEHATEAEKELAKNLLRIAHQKEKVTFVNNSGEAGSYTESKQTVIDARWSSNDFKQGENGAAIEQVILKNEIHRRAYEAIGEDSCLECMLNSPGNFTASKLRWVKENEPEIYKRIDKIMLPGDYIAMKLTGETKTTISGLSEGIFWDFKKNSISDAILDQYDFDKNIIPELVPTFAIQGEVSNTAATELGLEPGTLVSYRAGDQPNNAFSLNVLNPGEIAATAGTSGVVYGVSDVIKYDPQSRVNTFAHVNHTTENNRLGVLLCINGTGILYSWLKKNMFNGLGYDEMNNLAASVPIGSEGLSILPFGNGAERVLGNQNPGASVNNLNFNIHTKAHMIRASQEGIVFSFKHGLDIMEQIGT